MRWREREISFVPDGETTAELSEPDEQGRRTVLQAGYYHGYPLTMGAEIRVEDVRCPNPKCRKKLAEGLTGTLVMTCRYCGQRVTITR